MSECLLFLHLSDIHFKRWSGKTIHDLDIELRHELLTNCPDIIHTHGNPTGILVTGDIAFSGSPDEYTTASLWLNELCRTIQCEPEQCWIVPGNHDVHLPAVNESKHIRSLHQLLYNTPVDRTDDELREILEDPASGQALLSPLDNYNEFAKRFKCEINHTRPYWEEHFQLGNGRTLAIRGLTSVLASTREDRVGTLVLGSAQSVILRRPDVDYMTLCHHPLDWLKDRDLVTAHLEANVRVQLFGHKHSQRITRINDGMRICAGAMHPERTEQDWIPTYNILHFSPLNAEQIQLRVYPMQWDSSARRFVSRPNPATGERWHELIWPESVPHQRPNSTQTFSAPSTFSGLPVTCDDAAVDMQEVEQMTHETMGHQTPGRRLTFQFVSLPFRKQIMVAQKLDLLSDADSPLSDTELLAVLYRRAVSSNLVEQLAREIENQYAETN